MSEHIGYTLQEDNAGAIHVVLTDFGGGEFTLCGVSFDEIDLEPIAAKTVTCKECAAIVLTLRKVSVSRNLRPASTSEWRPK